MRILAWLAVGRIGGLIAKLLVPGHGPGVGGVIGVAITILVGIVGAPLGGFLAVAPGMGNGVDDFDLGTIVLSVIGAIIILVGHKLTVRSAADR